MELPTLPGVYKYYDIQGVLLYVGKAINLYNRVKSYFSSKNLSPRVHLFVKQIDYIELTVTQDENSALLLEKQLILQLQPRYNILLKHDTTTPGILLSYHKFPRCSYYRGNKSDIENADYFPMHNSYHASSVINIIQKLYKIRNCSENVFNEARACMLYQIDRCSAPCIGRINSNEYNRQVLLVKKLLLGNREHAVKELKHNMETAIEQLAFEKAGVYRDQLQILENSKDSALDNLNDLTADVVVYNNQGMQHYYYLISIVNGKYVNDRSFEFTSELNNDNLHKVFLDEYYCHYIKFSETLELSKIDVYFSEYDMLDKDTLKYFETEQQIFIINPNSCDKILTLFSMGIQNLNLIMESKGRS
jgi:excinuclease ABC subunit C